MNAMDDFHEKVHKSYGDAEGSAFVVIASGSNALIEQHVSRLQRKFDTMCIRFHRQYEALS